MIRYHIRRIAAQPLSSTVSIIALALGIGVNVSCFTSINAIVLHPFSFPKSNELVRVWENSDKGGGADRRAVSPADFKTLKENSRAFSQMAAFQVRPVIDQNHTAAPPLQAAFSTKEFFQTLSIPPLLGRSLAAGLTGGGEREAVISYGFWRTQLASKRDAVGTELNLDGQNYTVVGVMPQSFDFPLGTDVWLPLQMNASEWARHDVHSLNIIGRLYENFTLLQAGNDLAIVAHQISEQWPDTNRDVSAIVVSLQDMPASIAHRFIIILLGAATFVLLLACANVANIGLIRAVGRKKEVAIRVALGGRKADIARQLIIETLLLAAAGGCLGIFFASLNLRLTRAIIPQPIFRMIAGLQNMHIGWHEAVYTVAISVFFGMLCALPSILHLFHEMRTSRLAESINDGGRGSTGGRLGNHMQSAIVTTQIALALALLIGAGFMYKTFGTILRKDRGFTPNGILLASVALPQQSYNRPSQILSYYIRLLQEASRLPGASSSAIASPQGSDASFHTDDHPLLLPADLRPSVTTVSAGYFDVMQIPIERGRSIQTTDNVDARRVAIVSASVARFYWPHGDPLEHQVTWQGHSYSVIGVCGDIKTWFGDHLQPDIYLSAMQEPRADAQLLVRVSGRPDGLQHVLTSSMAGIDPQASVYNVKSYTQVLEEQTSGIKVSMIQMGVYGLIALLLSVTGIYSLLSYRTAMREREVSIRMALGAKRADILRMCMMMSFNVIVLGIAAGISMGLFMSRLMTHALSSASALDLGEVVSVTALLVVAIVAAILFPARRAMHVDPARALMG